MISAGFENMAPKDVKANRPIGVDVGVVDPGCEGYLKYNQAMIQWYQE